MLLLNNTSRERVAVDIHSIMTGTVAIKTRQREGAGTGRRRFLNMLLDREWTDPLPILARNRSVRVPVPLRARTTAARSRVPPADTVRFSFASHRARRIRAETFSRGPPLWQGPSSAQLR